MNKKVMVGMSGGVDSSVTALLLKEQGYEVVGVTFKLWDSDEDSMLESGCCSMDDVTDARFVCDAIGIPHYVVNYKDLFKGVVVDYFVQEYLSGRTPNPCIACNRHIKFSAFLQKAQSMGFDFIATGHYARVQFDETSEKYQLVKSIHDRKDQTYVLYNLTQNQLSHLLMPLGDYSKEQVREIACEHGLVVSGKPDSQDICFVPDGDYLSFLEQYTGRKSPRGAFVDPDGTVLGQHGGVWRYTIGQRKGLGMGFGKPVFVSGVDLKKNTVTVGEESLVFSDTLTATDINFVSGEFPAEPLRVQAKIRYSHKATPAVVTMLEDGVMRAQFDTPQRAITPGQAVVLYDGDVILGGGTIL